MIEMKIQRVALAAVIVLQLCSLAGASAAEAAEAAEAANAVSGAAAPAAKRSVKVMQEDFLRLKFGMFIHYNMATYHGTQWVEGNPCPSTFDPGGPVDTDAWADAAKAAGMTYGVLTAKHVAGFCLWDSGHTEYDIMHPKSPVREDLVGKFIKSFTSRGLKAGIYYCWRSPGFAERLV